MRKEAIADAEVIERPYGVMTMLAGGKHAKTLNVDLRILNIRPGEATTRHHHVRSESIFHVQRGQFVMEVGYPESVNTPLEAGDTMVIDPNEIHCLRNTGAYEGIVIEAMGPPFSQKDIHFAPEEGHSV